MPERVRWGILGTGKIAAKFAQDLRLIPQAEILAVGSRSRETAEAFGKRFRIPRRYPSYAALVDDPEVDVVHVATPHTLHAENSRMSLEAGKAVLCEKPFTLNASQAADVIALARRRRLFLMEAMWTRFLPAVDRLRRLLAEGILGEVRLLCADFGLRFEFDPASRIFAPELGGGALLDLGVYPVSFASMVFGPPTSMVSLAQLGETGVDDQAGIVFRHARGQIACLYTATRAATPTEAILVGTEGRLRVHAPMYRPEALTLTRPGRKDRRFEHRIEGVGLHYEARHVMQCLQERKLESELMPLEESLAVMKTLDALRSEWGVHYPGE